MPPRAWVWPRSNQLERQISLFGQMMSRVGADPNDEIWERIPNDLAAASHRCLGCRNSTQCQQWLESGGSNDAPPFCPNAALLRHVRAVLVHER
jgi:hypothetical protein